MSFLKNIPTNPLTDGELIESYKQTGDLDTLGKLYEKYMDLVYGVCLKYFKESERSKDAVMQIFEDLVTKLKKHDVENFKKLALPGSKELLPDAIKNSKEFKDG